MAAYHHGRALARDALGVDPGRRLRESHQAILTGPARPRQLPPDIAGFIGRDREVHTASRVAAGGARATIVVTGPAGAGKSALAVHIAHLLKGSYPDGQLFAAVGNTPVKDVLGQLLRALGTTDLPTGVGDRRELYQRLCATRAMVVVLDDVRDGRTAVDLHPGSGRHLVLVTNRDAASIHVHNGQSAVLQVRSRPGS